MDLTEQPSERVLVDIWQEELDTVADLAAGLDEAQWRAATPCPGWSSGDVVAHLVDIEQLLVRSPRPDHEPDWSTLPHAEGDFGRFTEVGVDYRRSMAQADVVAELRSTVAERRRQLDEVPDGAEVLGPMGNPTTMDRLLRMRLLDSWMHEQDIRQAAGLVGGLDSRAAVISYQQIQRALPLVWAKKSAAPGGSTVHVHVTGPGLTGDMAATADDAGRGSECAVPGEPTVRITVSWPDLVALAAGRVDPSAPDVRSRLAIDGDPALASAFLTHLAITP